MIALALGLVAGLLVGEAGFASASLTRGQLPPDGWTPEAERLPYKLAALSGALAPEPGAWGLDFWQGFYRHGRAPVGALSLEAEVQEGGQLEVWLSASPANQRGEGWRLTVERVGEPGSSLQLLTRTGPSPTRCTGALAAPSSDPLPIELAQVDGGVRARTGDSEITCTGRSSGLHPLLRPGLRRVLVRNLAVDGQPIPPPTPPLRPLWWLGGLVLIGGLITAELRSGARAALVLASTLPLLLIPSMWGVDLRLWAETARVTWLPVSWLGLLLPLGLALALKGLHHLGRLAREHPEHPDWPAWPLMLAALPLGLALALVPAPIPALLVGACATALGVPLGLLWGRGLARLGSAQPRRTATWSLAIGGLGALAVVAMDTPFHLGAAYGALVGLGLALVTWANANVSRVRVFNLLSLAGVGLAIVAGEGALRATQAGVAWGGGSTRTSSDDIYGWVQTARLEFESLDAGEHTTYPSDGYPVAVTPRQRPMRVVAMGGSTTGGAWQNDDLQEFYPARLQELLGDRAQVINQGVGGWTTFHMRRYALDHLDSLDPDLLTLYVGHNDLLTAVPLPYEQLYASWQTPGAGRAVGDALGRFRLYSGLRYLLTSLRPASSRVAVPVDHAEANLRAISGAVSARGGQVLLLSEGMSPSPGPLVPYNDMMARLAEELPGLHFRDVAETLHDLEQAGGRPFIDDCHLTDDGHRAVAREIQSAMEQLDRGELAPSSPRP